MIFYGKAGVSITLERFITLYGDSYYLDKERYVPGVSQSSRYTEDEIDRLLREGIKCELDVIHILAWKIGKIRHAESKSRFCYSKDWSNAESFRANRYGKEFDLKTISQYIVKNIESLEDQAKSNPQKVLNDLRDINIKGLGSVYLVTLLYFISRNTFPIYDRFAKMAIDAIETGLKPGSSVCYCELPTKDSKEFGHIMDDYIYPYQKKLETQFGDKYREGRDVDRALWVYGHMFRRG